MTGVSDHALRRWREEPEEADNHAGGCFKGPRDEELRPVPDESATTLATMYGGRAEERQELINTISRLGRRKEGPVPPYGRAGTRGQHGRIAWIRSLISPKKRFRADIADIFMKKFRKIPPFFRLFSLPERAAIHRPLSTALLLKLQPISEYTGTL